MQLRWLATCGVLVAGACAPTTGTGSLPVEVLVVLDQAERSLIVTPVDSSSSLRIISISPVPVLATSLAVRGSLAAIGLAGGGSVILVDLAKQEILRTISLFADPVSAIAFGEDGRLYVASRDASQVFRIDPATGAGDLVTVPGGPQGFGVVRGRVYGVSGNRIGCPPIPAPCSTAPSWLSTISNGVTDSIPLLGPGNAGPAAAGADGLLYVLSTGDGAPVEGRLSVVDPVRNVELASFGGFGPAPRWLASDGADRVLVLSAANGLMVFNSRERRVERGAGLGIPFQSPGGVTVDALGRIYVLEQGSCSTTNPGRVRVFGADLIERPPLTGGICPVAAATTDIPADQLGLDN